ncbi:NADH-quinone oxidoreductase subunit 5 family protein [Aquirufa sp. ROCK2-A2]
MGLPFLFSMLILSPWISALIIGFFPKKLQRYTSVFSIFLSGISFILGISLVLLLKGQIARASFPWFTVGKHLYKASFFIDSPAQIMVVLVTLVAFFVQIFSKSYLKSELKIGRYYTYLHLFVGAMLALVLTDQIWIFYGSWELVGACSFLLIGFWHQKERANKAAKKAFLLNRLGDIGLLIGFFALFMHFKSDRFSDMDVSLFGTAPFYIGLALLAGGIGKSAQFPLMSWLPDAMEGPTPASALIHAATMVTAGVFLGIRIFPIVGEETHLMMAVIGAISLLAGAIFALFQNDIKKTLAYSTISQIGLMWMGMGSGVSLLHLVVHGIFKAGLFLSAGYVIHYIHHQESSKNLDAQSLDQMGGLKKFMPINTVAYFIFGLGLIGIPFTSGFISKENLAGYLIEYSTQSVYSGIYIALLISLGLGMLLSSFYISRQFYLIFLGENRKGLSFQNTPTNCLQIIPIIVLACLSLSIWIHWNPLDASNSSLLRHFQLNIYHAPDYWLYISAFTWIGGIAFTYLTRNWIPSNNYQFMPKFWPNLFTIVFYKSRIANLVEIKLFDKSINGIYQSQVVIAHLSAWFDSKVIDGILVKLTAQLSQSMGMYFSRWQSGKVRSYWILIFITFGLFLLYFLM